MTLAEEAQRYLAVVEFFRAEGCEPHWRPEAAPPPANQILQTKESLLQGSSRGA